jgi:hypothetical protein
MSDRAWLDGLQPGDEVAVRVDHGARHMLARVSRRTGTLILCNLGGRTDDRFRATDGYRTPRERWDHRVIEPVTDEIRAAVQRERDLAAVRYANWQEVPPATLRAVCTLLKAKG